MDEVIFVEVLDRSGRLKERTRLERLPATIGRSYQNDVILDDRFVSPEHARIARDDGGNVVVQDLGSTNGVYVAHPPQRVDRATCGPNTLLRIGHSLLRIRRASDAVEPAAVEGTRFLPLESRWASVAIFVGGACLVALFEMLETYERIEAKNVVLGLLVVFLIMLFWASGWALASRVIVHQARLREHATVATLAMIAMSIVSTILDVATFSLGVEEWNQVLVYVVIAVLFAAVLYGHLGLVSLAAPSQLARTAIIVSVLLVGLIALFAEIGDTEFSSTPAIPAALKPPIVRLASAKPPEGFLVRARPLKDEVDEWALEP
jgi:hypothetical protein